MDTHSGTKDGKPVRILMSISKPFPEGGADTRRIHTLARELAAQGARVSVLLAFARQPQAFAREIDGLHVSWCYVPATAAEVLNRHGYVRMRVQIQGRLRAVWRVWTASLRRQYDWLYLYQPGIDGLLQALVARLCGRRVCTEYTDRLSAASVPRGLRWRIMYALWWTGDRLAPRLSSLILVISHELEAHYRGLAPKTRILRLPVVVDVDAFGHGDPQRFRTGHGVSSSGGTVVFTGSFSQPQGVATLVEAVARVVHSHPDAKLLIAGGSMGADVDDVDALIARHSLAVHARNLGRLPRAEVIDLLAAADVCVLPKLDAPVNHAGLSTKLAEYLAAGKPVVASRVGDVSHYLVHEEHALLTRPGDVGELADAIDRLLSDTTLARRLGSAGRRLAEAEFDVRGNVRRLLAAFDNGRSGRESILCSRTGSY